MRSESEDVTSRGCQIAMLRWWSIGPLDFQSIFSWVHEDLAIPRHSATGAHRSCVTDRNVAGRKHSLQSSCCKSKNR